VLVGVGVGEGEGFCAWGVAEGVGELIVIAC
jgi:hypothetical protein